MPLAPFNTLRFANTLKAAGVPDKQAEAEAEAIGEALAVNLKDLATKEELQQQIRESEQRLNAKIEGVEQRLNAKIEGVEQRLNAKIDTAVAKLGGEMALIRYMFGIVITLLIGVLVRLFFGHTP